MRRSLLAVQVLPVIQPSAGFRLRLAERLRLDAIEQRAVRPSGVRWGVAGVIVAASVALLVVSSSHAHQTASHRAVPIVAQTLVQPVVLQPKAPFTDSAAMGRTASVTATAPKTITARFEALSGAYVARPNAAGRSSAMRFQTVSYQGQ